MTTISNSPNHDAALKLAGTVGTNIGTLRKNKRALAYNMILAVSVEGFAWSDVWAAGKKAMGFAKLEKPEQNQVNVFGSAIKTVILGWSGLTPEVRADFTKGDIVFSTLAASIKEADKARDAADKEASDKEDAAKAASQQSDADHGDTPPVAPPAPPVEDRTAMIEAVAAMFSEGTAFSPSEIAAMVKLVNAVDAFKQETIAKAA